MNLLILGGTRFLGRHVALEALRRGHAVSLFNRGNNAVPELAACESLKGDRDESLAALDGRRWDAVVDTCGYFPRQVRATAGALADRVGFYAFISSISVYRLEKETGIDEGGPLGEHPDLEAQREITGENYGPLKVACECAAEAAMPGRVAQVRAGLIVGPHDPTDRFTYWVRRGAEPGPILAPVGPTVPVQFIDVRDIAAFTLDLAEKRAAGIFNTTGPAQGTATLGEILDAAQGAASVRGEVRWLSEQFLEENNVAPWSELPLWIPGEMGRAFSTVSVAKAVAAGLRTRGVAETVADTLAWDRTRGKALADFKAGLKRAREAELLALAE